jgi:hypothetical protein
MAECPLVGLLAALRPGIAAADLTAAATLFDPLAGPVALGSPWAPDHHLASIVVEDILGMRVPGPPTRSDAIRVPAVARARGVVCTTIARIDVGAYRGETRLDTTAEPSWLHATDGPVSPFHRMLWTIDDLLFYGWSCWSVTHEGLLVEGAPAVSHARDLQRGAHNAARFPTAYLGLKQTTGAPLKRRSDDENEVTVETVLRDWRYARLNPDGGGVAWLGGVEPVEIGTFAEHLVTAGRNAADVDVARHAYIPADLIDASVPESSLHYSTSRDNDVTPRGQRIAFDLEQWLRGAAPLPGQLPTQSAPGLTESTDPATPTAPALETPA